MEIKEVIDGAPTVYYIITGGDMNFVRGSWMVDGEIGCSVAVRS